MGDGRGM